MLTTLFRLHNFEPQLKKMNTRAANRTKSRTNPSFSYRAKRTATCGTAGTDSVVSNAV